MLSAWRLVTPEAAGFWKRLDILGRQPMYTLFRVLKNRDYINRKKKKTRDILTNRKPSSLDSIVS